MSGAATELQTWISDVRARVDDRLARIASEAQLPDPLWPALQHALHSGGKRVRAALVIAVGEAAGATRLDAHVRAGAAIEMVHTSSLILDDLPAMDDAEMRRGAPALHRVVGEDLAILTAVALLNHGYGEIAEAWHLSRPRRYSVADLVRVLVDAVGWDGTIGGEAVDLHCEDSELDFRTLEYIHSRKTGALFVASAESGAMLANASSSTVDSIRNYAKNLGLAFQIVDDVLDATADAADLGKDVGKDEQKLTFVKLAGVDGSRSLVNELVETSVASLTPLGRRGRKLEALARWVGQRAR